MRTSRQGNMVAEAASLWRERLVNRTFCGFCLCLMQSRFFGNGRMEENLKDWYQKDEQEILKELHVTKEGLTAVRRKRFSSKRAKMC